MSDVQPYTSVESDGFTVETNGASLDDLKANFGMETAESDPTPAEEPADEQLEVKAETPEPEKPKVDKRTREGRKASIQAEIDELTATKHATKRELEAAQAQLKELRAELAKSTPPAKPEPAKPTAAVSGDPEPTPDQFDTYEKYVKAQAKWEARQEIHAAREKERADADTARKDAEREARYQRFESEAAQFTERFTKARESDPQILNKINPVLLETPRLSHLDDPSKATFAHFLVEQAFLSDHPAELLVHVSDPTIAQRLATLPPEQVIRELAKYEARLEAATSGPAQTPKPVSQATAPIKPVGASPHLSDDAPDPDSEDFDAHKRYYDALDRKKRAAR